MRAGLGAARRSARWDDDPSPAAYRDRSPEGMRAGLGAARRSARWDDDPSPAQYRDRSPEAMGSAWGGPALGPDAFVKWVTSTAANRS